MIESVLQRFGLNEKSSRVYLTLLRLGSASVRTIAEQANVNRTTAHDILNSLMEEGLVSYVDKEKHRYYTAEPPEHLLTALKIRQDRIAQTSEDVEKVLPELKAMYEKSESRPKAKYFEGHVGLHSVLQDVLDTVARYGNGDKCYYVYSSSTIRNTVHQVYPNYNEERKQRDISVQTISIGPGGDVHGLDERKWLSREAGAPTYTILYLGKIALISLDERKQPIGVVVEDQNTYQTQVMIFNALWRLLK